MAVGVALSPVPIIAVVLMLGTPRARSNGPAFLFGWIVGLLVVGTIAMLVSGGAGAHDDGEPATWVLVMKIVLGVLLVAIALRMWRGRPAPGEQPALPTWMQAMDTFTSARATGAGLLLSGVNPKNLVLTLAAGKAIAATGVSTGQQFVALVVFALIGTIGPGLPVAVYFLMGDRAPKLLAEMKSWLGANNTVIMVVLCVVIAAKLVGDGIAGLTG
jgi:threonine/homoserine/homoserine lactone efflux protein